MPSVAYGKLIREHRELRGWSQVELAERVNVSPATVSNWEREVTPPGTTDVNRVCLSLGISPEILLGEMGVTLSPPAAARLPRSLVLALLELSPEDLATIERTAQALASYQAREPRTARR